MKINKYFTLLVSLLVARVIFAFIVWHPDVFNHIDWGIRFFEYGPDKFFAPESNVWSFTWPNQPPGSLYLYAFIKVVYDFVFGIFLWINNAVPAFPSVIVGYFELNLYPAMLQLPSILADFGISYFIYKFIQKLGKPKLAKTGAIIFLLNPVIWYNSSVWGQTDSLINFFAIASIYVLLYSKRPFLSVLMFATSLYIKMSLVIFAPIYLIIFLKKFNLKKLVSRSALVLIILLAITLPFSLGSDKDPLGWFVWLYQEKIFGQQLEVITANAFNIWATIAGIHEQPHTNAFAGLTYQYWGYIAFAIAYIPLLIKTWKAKKNITYVWTFSIAAIASWSLLTNMHERYLYPLFPHFTILVVLRPSLMKYYILISGLNLLNLYNYWEVPPIEVVKNILTTGNRVSARVFGFINFGLFTVLYKKFITRDSKLI